MSDKNIEMMKKLIEEKRKKGSEQNVVPKTSKNIGEARKAFKINKRGGLFDK